MTTPYKTIDRLCFFDIACRRIEDAQRVQDMFAHEVRDAYEMTQQQADLLEGE